MAAGANAQQPSLDTRVSDIARAGKIRVGLHLPQFVQDPATGEIKGQGTGAVIVQIAQALGTQLGVKVELVGHPSPPKLIECLQAHACDTGFLGFCPRSHQRGRFHATLPDGAVHHDGVGKFIAPQHRRS